MGFTTDQVLAQALATSVRKCIYTGVRIPVFFQVKFHAVKHPKTGAPWFVPVEEVVQDLPSKTTKSRQEEDEDLDQSDSPETHPPPETKEVIECSPEHDEARSRPNGAAAYMLARQSLLHNISQKSRTHRGEMMRLIPPRWKRYTYIRAEKTVWREDMDTYYLDILRNTVLGKLEYLRLCNAGYLVTTAKGLDGIPEMSQMGAVLWLGRPAPHSDPASPSSSAVESEPKGAFPPEGPEPYLMVKYKGHHIPVYNMRTMLGEEMLQALGVSDHLFASEFVMLKAKKNTVKTRMLLWKLQIYTAYFSGTKARDVVGTREDALEKDSGVRTVQELPGMETAA